MFAQAECVPGGEARRAGRIRNVWEDVLPRQGIPRRIKPGVLSRSWGRTVQTEYSRGNYLGRAALAYDAWEGAPPRQTMLNGSAFVAEASPVLDLHRLAAVHEASEWWCWWGLGGLEGGKVILKPNQAQYATQ